MAFTSVADFLAMGGYAFYVWLAYGISFLSLIILLVNTINKKRIILMKVKQAIARQVRMKNAQNKGGTL